VHGILSLQRGLEGLQLPAGVSATRLRAELMRVGAERLCGHAQRDSILIEKVLSPMGARGLPPPDFARPDAAQFRANPPPHPIRSATHGGILMPRASAPTFLAPACCSCSCKHHSRAWRASVCVRVLARAVGVLHGVHFEPRPRHRDVLFFPSDAAKQRLLALLRSARRSCDVAVYTISDHELRDALLHLHRHGVAVRVISDDEMAMSRGSDVVALAEVRLMRT
jgi:hypothetical protein